MNKNYIDDIKAEIKRARFDKTLNATCTYLVLKYYDELSSYPLSKVCSLFERTDSWMTEFNKARALGRLMRSKGEL